MISQPAPEARLSAATSWVEAAPFRAHVRHLMAAGDLTCAMVAVLTGLSLPAVEHLVEGAHGRPVRKITGAAARRLLRITAADVRAINYQAVPADMASRHLRRLMAAGWSAESLCRLLGITRDELAALASHHLRVCNRRVAIRLAAEVSAMRCGRLALLAPAA